MSYRFTSDHHYEDLASGRVLYNQHGTTAFPVRLASEIFLRAKQHLTRKGNAGPYHLYDPCGGGAIRTDAENAEEPERTRKKAPERRSGWNAVTRKLEFLEFCPEME